MGLANVVSPRLCILNNNVVIPNAQSPSGAGLAVLSVRKISFLPVSLISVNKFLSW